jgi:hypothetical protein
MKNDDQGMKPNVQQYKVRPLTYADIVLKMWNIEVESSVEALVEGR